LRRELMKVNPRAIRRVHVASEIFQPRRSADGVDRNGLKTIRPLYSATGGQFLLHEGPIELFPGIWFTAAVPRVTEEKNWSRGLRLETSKGIAEDTVPEDAALLFNTKDGIVILTGCGHAGIINIAQYARSIVGPRAIFAVIGGLHLFAASDETVAWTAQNLKNLGLHYLLAGHCTGIEATFRLREAIGLDRRSAVVSAVGSSFTLGKGIDPRELAG
jgi:7,8-dihydropterin-6-yl-methyl-4-(beta-D-ribofuranosyl)aminobenzene 5'-phosphate synthase